MPADSYYDNLNHRLASPEFCLDEDECEECGHPAHKGECGFERGGERPGDGESCATAWPPCQCRHGIDRVSTAEEVHAAIEQERILEASRSVRRGDNMLFAALRQNGVIR